MKRRYITIIAVALAAILFIGFALQSYTAPELLRSRKAIITTVAAGGALSLIALWARHKMKTAQTKKERKNAQHIMRLCTILGVGSFGASVYGAFSEASRAKTLQATREQNLKGIKRADGSLATIDALMIADINAEGFNLDREAPTVDQGTLLSQPLHSRKKAASGTEHFYGEQKVAEQEAQKMLLPARLLFPEAEDIESNTLMGVFLNIANSDKESIFDARRIIDYSPISLSAVKSVCNLATDDDWRANGNRFLGWLMQDKYGSPVRTSLLSTAQELSGEMALKELLGIAKRVVAANRFTLSEQNQRRFDALISEKEIIKFW